jgi:hypothetical protein
MRFSSYANISPSAAIQFMQDCLLYGFSTFLPSILKAMNYDTLQANYLTIPVYMWGAISFLFLAWISDRISLRGPVSTLFRPVVSAMKLIVISDSVLCQHIWHHWVHSSAHSEERRYVRLDMLDIMALGTNTSF